MVLIDPTTAFVLIAGFLLVAAVALAASVAGVASLISSGRRERPAATAVTATRPRDLALHH